MLEDDFTYVIRKAFKGLALSPGEAAQLAGIPEGDVLAFSKGKFSANTARRLAPVLGLDAVALAKHNSYLPEPLASPNIHRLDLPFGMERVNAWLVSLNDTAVLFDAGYERKSCAGALAALGKALPEQIFITHDHPDHVGGIPTFIGKGAHLHGSHIHHAAAMKPGDEILCGLLTIRACDLSGHANPSLGYHIDGLASPILVTGDALFAGSMGGCATPALYQHALERLKKVLAPLRDHTILLPGHGPATTLGEERVSNPFL